jgi:hypothetical protein
MHLGMCSDMGLLVLMVMVVVRVWVLGWVRKSRRVVGGVAWRSAAGAQRCWPWARKGREGRGPGQ